MNCHCVPLTDLPVALCGPQTRTAPFTSRRGLLSSASINTIQALPSYSLKMSLNVILHRRLGLPSDSILHFPFPSLSLLPSFRHSTLYPNGQPGRYAALLAVRSVTYTGVSRRHSLLAECHKVRALRNIVPPSEKYGISCPYLHKAHKILHHLNRFATATTELYSICRHFMDKFSCI